MQQSLFQLCAYTFGSGTRIRCTVCIRLTAIKFIGTNTIQMDIYICIRIRHEMQLCCFPSNISYYSLLGIWIWNNYPVGETSELRVMRRSTFPLPNCFSVFVVVEKLLLNRSGKVETSKAPAQTTNKSTVFCSKFIQRTFSIIFLSVTTLSPIIAIYYCFVKCLNDQHRWIGSREFCC